MLELTKYIRYFLVSFIVISLFYLQNNTININNDLINKNIEKKLPFNKRSKFVNIKIINLKTFPGDKDYINANAFVLLSLNIENNIIKNLTRFYNKIKRKNTKIKKLQGEFDMNVKPFIKNNNIYLKILNVNSKSIKISSKIEKKVIDYINFILKKTPIYKLDNFKYKNFFTIKNIIVKNNISDYDLKLKLKLNILSYILIYSLIILLLLREIGIFLIYIYRKFFSKKKKYKCAKGHVTGETCSTTVLKDFKKNGFISGMKTYFKSTKECKKHYDEIQKQNSKSNNRFCETAVCDSPQYFLYSRNTTTAVEAGDASSAACDAGACDAGACDAGACDAGACDIGAC